MTEGWAGGAGDGRGAAGAGRAGHAGRAGRRRGTNGTDTGERGIGRARCGQARTVTHPLESAEQPFPFGIRQVERNASRGPHPGPWPPPSECPAIPMAYKVPPPACPTLSYPA
ncbi:hypothetical protein GCM10010389_29080 [Streptomyces echinoruber]|uniref:Uncharacterized protein n=1 Tax=Streptomyces echinoruber TaxID=68898 RepID=A0A918VCE8_9ACTN|nr:hypothetical protein GCM10010389_29080 [Streptomyces echinoruber]